MIACTRNYKMKKLLGIFVLVLLWCNVSLANNFKVVVETSTPRTKIPGRVDINNLMSKVREEERKQKKENVVLFGFISGVIVVTGIIASL